MSKSKFFLRSGFCILHSALLLTPGCQVVGTVTHTVFGDPAIKAQYVPPKGTTLVLVENYRSPDEMQLDGDQIAHEITDELKKDGKIDTIDPDKLAPLREEDATKYRQMNIQEVGRAGCQAGDIC